MILKPYSGTIFVDAEINNGDAYLLLKCEVKQNGEIVSATCRGIQMDIDILEKLAGQAAWDAMVTDIMDAIPEAIRIANEDAADEYGDWKRDQRMDLDE